MNRLYAVAVLMIILAVGIGSVSAAPPIAYTELIVNGSFSSSFSSWNRGGNTVWDVQSGVLYTYGPSSVSTFYQDIGNSSVLNYPYEINFLMGNTANASKTVQVTLSNGVNATGWITCTFVVPASAPLLNYRIQGLDGQGWAQMRLAFTFTTFSSSPALLLDTVSVQYWPGAQTAGTTCTAPTATATPTPTPSLTPTFTPSPTFTFTPSLTPSNTPTATPAIAMTWALPTLVVSGTPQPAQYVQFSYDLSAGDVAVSVLLAAVLIAVVMFAVIWLLLRRKK